MIEIEDYDFKKKDSTQTAAAVVVTLALLVILGLAMMGGEKRGSQDDYGVDYYDVCGTSRGC